MIRWSELLEKFRSVQERARRASGPTSGNQLDSKPRFIDLRNTEGTGPSKPQPEPPARRQPGPSIQAKEAKDRQKSGGLGRQFGRLTGVKGRRGNT